MSTERLLLEQLIKSWAQDHTDAYIISDLAPNEEAMKTTQGHLTWVVREGHANLDLLGLVERLELFLDKKNKKIDGMHCKKCQTFYHYAEPNQSDGSMICYSCRQNPYG